jgi:hypothetical protein
VAAFNFVHLSISQIEDLIINKEAIAKVGWWCGSSKRVLEIVNSLYAATSLTDLEVHHIYTACCYYINRLTVKVLGKKKTNIGYMWAILRDLSIFACIQHRYPVRLGSQ